MKNNKYAICIYGGTLLIDLLTVIFIILKLCNKIDWSWLLVFAPLWIVILIGLPITAIIFYWEDRIK